MARLCERPGCSVPASVAYGFEAERYLVWVESVPVVATDSDDIRSGLLCRRHADALTPPRGWWLDDRRDPSPQLFREPELPKPVVPVQDPSGAVPRRRRAGMSAKRDLTGELPFDEIVGAAQQLADIDGAELAANVPVPDDELVSIGSAASDLNADVHPVESAVAYDAASAGLILVLPAHEVPADGEAVLSVDESIAAAVALVATPGADVVIDVPDPDETKAIPWSPQFDHNDDLGGVLNVRSPLLSRAFRGMRPNT
jgi:hypothetical protein